ncbi:MAG: hypothetical protein U0414_17835 [Polyangiaceae bacterium]
MQQPPPGPYGQPPQGYGQYGQPQAPQPQAPYAQPQIPYGAPPPGPSAPLVAPPPASLSVEGRIFLPLRILFGLALIAGGVALAWFLREEWNEGHRIRIKGVVLIALAPIAGIATMISAFSKGCTTCKKELEARRYAYPAAMYGWLAEQLRIGGRALEAFVRSPVDMSPQTTVLQLHTCPKCEALGSAQVKQELRSGDSITVQASTELRPLGAEDVWMVPALRQSRQPIQ